MEIDGRRKITEEQRDDVLSQAGLFCYHNNINNSADLIKFVNEKKAREMATQNASVNADQ